MLRRFSLLDLNVYRNGVATRRLFFCWEGVQRAATARKKT